MNLVEALSKSADQQPHITALKLPIRIRGELSYQNRSFADMQHAVDLLATYLFAQK